jgi:hypothetical protein
MFSGSSLISELSSFPQIAGLQTSYNWNLMLPDLYGILVSGVVVGKYCQAVKFGQYNISSVEEFRVGTKKRFFPAECNIEPVSMNFMTTTPDLVTCYFRKWRSLIIDDLGRYNLPSLYKQTAYIMFTAQSGMPVNVVKLKGIFPLSAPSFDLGYSTETPVAIPIEFRVDYVDIGLDELSKYSAIARIGMGALGL